MNNAYEVLAWIFAAAFLIALAMLMYLVGKMKGINAIISMTSKLIEASSKENKETKLTDSEKQMIKKSLQTKVTSNENLGNP